MYGVIILLAIDTQEIIQFRFRSCWTAWIFRLHIVHVLCVPSGAYSSNHRNHRRHEGRKCDRCENKQELCPNCPNVRQEKFHVFQVLLHQPFKGLFRPEAILLQNCMVWNRFVPNCWREWAKKFQAPLGILFARSIHLRRGRNGRKATYSRATIIKCHCNNCLVRRNEPKIHWIYSKLIKINKIKWNKLNHFHSLHSSNLSLSHLSRLRNRLHLILGTSPLPISYWQLSQHNPIRLLRFGRLSLFCGP